MNDMPRFKPTRSLPNPYRLWYVRDLGYFENLSGARAAAQRAIEADNTYDDLHIRVFEATSAKQFAHRLTEEGAIVETWAAKRTAVIVDTPEDTEQELRDLLRGDS